MVVKAGKCKSAAIFAGLGCRVVSGSHKTAEPRYEPGVDIPERICAVMRWVARSKGLSHNFANACITPQASARPSRRCLQTLARHRRAIFWQGNVLTFAVRKNRGQLYGLHADLPPTPLHDLRHGAPSSGNGLEAIPISTPASCSPLTLTPACCPTSPTTPRNRCHGPLRPLSRPHPIGLRAASPPGQRSERR
jgi:hypothetical protein